MSTQTVDVHVLSVGASKPRVDSAVISFAAVHARLSRSRFEESENRFSYAGGLGGIAFIQPHA